MSGSTLWSDEVDGFVSMLYTEESLARQEILVCLLRRIFSEVIWLERTVQLRLATRADSAECERFSDDAKFHCIGGPIFFSINAGSGIVQLLAEIGKHIWFALFAFHAVRQQ